MAALWMRALAILLAIVATATAADRPEPELGRLRRHVETLASPEFAGRKGDGARKAEAYILRHFRELGLEPLFDGSFTQDIPGKEPGSVLGRNIGAKIVGSEPARKDNYVVLSAHYDHLGVRNGVLYPGADDNASGVAMLLESARCMARGPEKPRRTIVLLAFDLEEDGLWGSRYFVQHAPFDLKKLDLFLTADLIGGSLADACKPYVFVMGSEHAPALRPILAQAGAGSPVRVGLLGSDVLLIDRSDYGPFRARGIPYLFFSTGEHPRYHTPADTPESLDYSKLEAISRIIHNVTSEAASVEALPPWSASSAPIVDEAVVVRDVLQRLLENRETLRIKPAFVTLMTRTMRQLGEIIERGSMTPAERTSMVRVAQLVLFSVL